MLCSLALRAGFGNILDLKCGCLRQELCAALIEQCDVGRQNIILHGKEYNLSPATFATIIGVGDGGTHVDLNDQAVDIIDLRAVYSSGPRGIHIAEVSMRDPNRLHKPQQTKPPRWNNVNNYAFQLLMERFGSFVDQNKESFQTLERRFENIEKILGELTSEYHGGSTKQPTAPDPPSNLKSQNPTSPNGKTMSKTEGKMILVSDDDSVDRKNLAEPIDIKQEFQTSTSMSVPITRPARNRRLGQYQLSPYDKVSRGANANEIIVSTDDQFISMHNFMSLLPNTVLSREQSALAVGADVDGFAQAATIRKPFMPNFRRCQKIYVPINDGVFHWFLFIVNVKEGYGEVWDALPSGQSNRKREQQAERILHSLDFIFHSKLPRNAKPSTQFIWFLIRSGEGHDSQDVHGRLAVQLIDSAFNEARARLLAQANVIFDEHVA
ncbi:hypothetical protein WN944_026857 [Citrus x changshan-huyou]|uniref:Ubiquitin-like protease family profile domain-containing protein n=1 Tax=Citrus x changshan-huyou TaxID=2935761 RepID=A0AAP0LHI8_9ROSI